MSQHRRRRSRPKGIGVIDAVTPGVVAFSAHRLTSTAEGLNSRIRAIRVQARGYRNREHFKTGIYFHFGGLDLYLTAA